MYIYVCMYGHTYMYTRPETPWTFPSGRHTYMCVRLYVHAYTCYVLTNPPIPFRPYAVKTWYFCVLFKFYFTREGSQAPPIVTSLKLPFFIFLKQSLCISRPVKILLRERGSPRGGKAPRFEQKTIMTKQNVRTTKPISIKRLQRADV